MSRALIRTDIKPILGLRKGLIALGGILLSFLLSLGIAEGIYIPLIACLLVLTLAFTTFYTEWSIAALLGLAPFHFLIKDLLNNFLLAGFSAAWRDVLLALIITGWLLRSFYNRAPIRPGPVALLSLIYVGWGIFEVFVRPDLLAGAFGFRSVFLPVLLMLPIIDCMNKPDVAQRYLRVLIVVGVAIALQAVAQFILVNGGLIEPGSFIDNGRAIYIETRGYAMSPRFGLARSHGPFPETGQIGLFLTGISGLLAPLAFNRGYAGARWAPWALVCVLLGVLSTISTWPILSTLIIIALAWAFSRSSKARRLRVIFLTATAVMLIALWSLAFKPSSPEELNRFVEESYSGAVVSGETRHLQDALLNFDLIGQGLYARAVSLSGGGSGGGYSTSDMDLGAGVFFFDSLVNQIGLVGIGLLLALWVSGIVRTYRGIALHNAVDTAGRRWPVATMAWAGLISMLLASQHYGAPIIYGTDLMLVLLLAIADKLPTWKIGGER